MLAAMAAQGKSAPAPPFGRRRGGHENTLIYVAYPNAPTLTSSTAPIHTAWSVWSAR
jgi:hypothetical protein